MLNDIIVEVTSQLTADLLTEVWYGVVWCEALSLQISSPEVKRCILAESWGVGGGGGGSVLQKNANVTFLGWIIFSGLDKCWHFVEVNQLKNWQ